MRQPRANQWTVVRLSHLGDVVLTTGVMAFLNRRYGTRFDVVTRASLAPILRGHPAVDEIVGLEESQLRPIGAWWRTCRELAERFSGQGLIDLHGVLRTRILGLAWKQTVLRYPKFGLVRRMFGRTRARLLRQILERTTVPQRYILAIESTAPGPDRLRPVIRLSPEEAEWARQRLGALPRCDTRFALHPYATHPAKTWPRERWRELAERIDEAGFGWFVVGRDPEPLFPGDERDLTNQTDLRQTCALLAEADALATGDSGPMHLACAVDTPVAAMFGPTARAWGFYPCGERDVVLEQQMDCRPCSLHGATPCPRGHACLADTSPETVLRSLRKLLKEPE